MEVLVGVAVGALFIIGAVGVIAPSLKTGQQVTQVQIRAQLGNELMQNVKSWAAGNWNAVLSLATGTSNTFFLNTATSSFTAVATSAEAIVVGGTTYSRYFYLGDLYRDTNGYVTTTAAGSNYDPSTKLITVLVSSLNNGSSVSTTITGYLTRNANNNINQTSWIGGSGQSAAVKVIGTSYATSVNVTVNASGSIQLAVPTGGTCSL